MSFNTIPEILEDLRAGRMVVMLDDEDRENEGDIVMAAQMVRPEDVNFMVREARGLLCLTLTEQRTRQLGLKPMVSDNTSPYHTNFTVSIEAAEGVTTGISAHDRARTIQVAVKSDARPQDLSQPGHIFPLTAQPGGVLTRAGHTEAGCDLARMAGLSATSVICEIMKDDGTMARLPDLQLFAADHGLKIGTIADLIEYRSRHESLVQRTLERDLDTAWGRFHLVAFRDLALGAIHLALVLGRYTRDDEVLVRVHEPLSVIDLLDAGPGTHAWGVGEALAAIRDAGRGAMVLLNCTQSAEALSARLADSKAHGAPHGSRSTDLRLYGIGAQILRELGVGRMKLMAAPRKMPSMAGFGLEVTGYVTR
jgi:3,4-dihydroxy 2-butanone 4-phosphate synthase / GTP cyclohydrolase II